MTAAFHQLHRAGQRASEAFAQQIEGSQITPRQYAVMAAIAETDLPSQTDLVTITGVDRSTLADIIRRLVRRGIVHRRRTKEDARAYQLKLTQKGEDELATVEAAARAADDALLSVLSTQERQTFLDGLSRIVGTAPFALKSTTSKPKRPARY